MSLERAYTIDDLRVRARTRIPRLAFDYIDGGAGSEATLERNRAAFDSLLLVQNFLLDVSRRSQGVDLLGRRFDHPIGVSPVGLADLVWPGTDTALAQTAADANIPFILSAAATTSIETVAKLIPDHIWFQLYVSTDDAVTFDLVARAKAAGISVLVVTVDLPVPAKRLRDLRNRFSLPFRINPAMAWDFATHPAWARATLAAGTPRFRSMERYLDPSADPQSLAAFMARQCTAGLDLTLMRRIREAWDGPMVVKGVMSTDTARRALDAGADGLIVSNHGGRQLDSAPATIDVLPEIVELVGDDVPVMLDSGIRSGSDVIKAYARGARFVFSGRCFLYGAAAGGAQGIARALEILVDEIDRTMGQVGICDLAGIGPDTLSTEPPKSQSSEESPPS